MRTRSRASPSPIAIGSGHLLPRRKDWSRRCEAAVDDDAALARERPPRSRGLAARGRRLPTLTAVATGSTARRAAPSSCEDARGRGATRPRVRRRRVAKRYHAIVSPAPRADAWEVRGFLGRVLDPSRYASRCGRPAPGFRASHSRFAVVARDARAATRWRASRRRDAPISSASTSRRAHADRRRRSVGGAPVERVLLHAEELRFTWRGGEVAIRAPIPAERASRRERREARHGRPHDGAAVDARARLGPARDAAEDAGLDDLWWWITSRSHRTTRGQRRAAIWTRSPTLASSRAGPSASDWEPRC
jgi:hypothetical protein